MPKLSYIARTFVQSRLLDQDTGFNYWIIQAAPDYRLQPFQLTNDAVNFLTGEFALGDIAETGFDVDSNTPLVMVYSKRATDTHIVTPADFAGPLITIVDFYQGFMDEGPPADSESPLDMIEDAMLETFNKELYYGLTPAGLTYNNEIDVFYGPMSPSGPNWIRLIRFALTHRFYTMGR